LFAARGGSKKKRISSPWATSLKMEMEKRRCGGLGALCLLCAAVLACLLLQPAGAADAKVNS
jgi:hypothetical protein